MDNIVKITIKFIIYMIFVVVNTLLIIRLNILDTTSSLTFFLLLTIITTGLLRSINTKMITLRLIIFIFAYFFHFFAPIIQIKFGRFPNYLAVENNLITEANVILCIFYIIIVVLPTIDMSRIESNFNVSRKIPFILIIILNLVNVIMMIFIIQRLGVGYYLGEISFFTIYNSTSALLLTSITNGVSVANLLYTTLYISTRKSVRNLFLWLFSLFMFIAHVNFFVSSRYYIAFVLILFMFVFFRNRITSTYFIFFLFIGIIIVFPLLNFFRNGITGIDYFVLDTFIESMQAQYTELHFDSYSQMLAGLKYIEDKGYMKGATTISSLLFFIPRSVFPFKTEGLGAVLGNYLAKTTIYGQIVGQFSNLSASIITEIYINFSFIGVIVIPVLIYYVLEKIKFKNSSIFMGIVYGFSFFIMRGDFMSSFAYFVGALVIVFYIPNKIINYFIRR